MKQSSRRKTNPLPGDEPPESSMLRRSDKLELWASLLGFAIAAALILHFLTIREQNIAFDKLLTRWKRE